jgi:hypothetical protein
MPKRSYKHTLLLDENMPHRTAFLVLNSQFDVKHVAGDLKQSGLPTPDVYQLAIRGRVFMV